MKTCLGLIATILFLTAPLQAFELQERDLVGLFAISYENNEDIILLRADNDIVSQSRSEQLENRLNYTGKWQLDGTQLNMKRILIAFGHGYPIFYSKTSHSIDLKDVSIEDLHAGHEVSIPYFHKSLVMSFLDGSYPQVVIPEGGGYMIQAKMRKLKFNPANPFGND